MKNFAYLQPATLEKAGQILARDGGARPMGGGTDLLDLMKSEIVTPARVLDLKALDDPGLRGIVERDGVLRIGALVTLAEVASSDLLSARYSALPQAASLAATPQLRHAGTVAGNLCQQPRCWYYRDAAFDCLRKGGDTCFAEGGRNRFHCVVGGGPCFIVHPSDLAVALLAFDARVLVRRRGAVRSVPIGEFYVLPETDHRQATILADDELVVGVEVPRPAGGARSSYTKFKYREGWDFAVVSVGLAAEVGGGAVRRGRIALGGVAPAPWLDRPATEALSGVSSDRGRLDAFAARVLRDAAPLEENGFKVPLARNLARRAVADLLAG